MSKTAEELDLPQSIKVKRISRVGYFGINSYPKSTTTICCQISKTGYNTGLTKSEETYFEEVLELKKGELNRHSKWWGEVFNVEHAIRLNATKATEFTLDNPIEQLKYKAMLASDKVSNSEIERNANALYYIDNPEAKAKAEMATYNHEFEGYGIIHKLTPEEKRSALRLFGKTGTDDLTETILNSQLMMKLKEDPKKFVEIMQDKNVKTKMFIQELIEKGLLKRKGNYFIHGEDTIASSTEEAVSYFQDIKNQSIKLMLDTKLNKNKKGKVDKTE